MSIDDERARGSEQAAYRAVVVGDLEVARLTCTALRDLGWSVTHLLEPGEAELEAALREPADAVAVVVRRDVNALRYVLLTEHTCPGVRLVATIFDRTMSAQLIAKVPNLTVCSPADVATPAVVAGCLGEEAPARAGLLSRVLHRPGVSLGDDSARMMLAGAAGLASILIIDWLIAVFALHEPPVDAFFAASRVLATVGPAGVGAHAPQWYLVVASLFMLAAIVGTALFTAGLVDWLASGRAIGLVGRRTLPRRNHVIVVGLGQVGLRVAMALRAKGIQVVGIERQPTAKNLRFARDARIPVLVGHAEDSAVLRRVGITSALAVASMGSDDLDNIDVAITALALAPHIRMVLRAGEGSVIEESRSLFAIGEVVDVSHLTADAVIALVTHQQSAPGRPQESERRPARCLC